MLAVSSLFGAISAHFREVFCALLTFQIQICICLCSLLAGVWAALTTLGFLLLLARSMAPKRKRAGSATVEGQAPAKDYDVPPPKWLRDINDQVERLKSGVYV